MTLHHAVALPATADERPQHGSVDDRERATAALFRQMEDAAASSDERRRIRARIIELNLPLATRLAYRYLNRGQSADDLRQVAALGLVKAVDGFDAARGKPFFGYLVPTVTGELKRHFRDHGWDVHVPRRLQERYLEVTRTQSALTQRLRRAPGAAEIGAVLGIADHEVVEALGAAAVYDVSSLNARVSGEDDAAERQEFIGAEDAALMSVCDKLVLRRLVQDLPERDRHILSLYFFAEMTQDRIAAVLGMSQMNVSRLLRRILDQLRRGLDDGAERPAEPSCARTGISMNHTRDASVLTVHGDVDASVLRRALVDAVVRARRGRVVVDLRQAATAGAVTARALVDAYRASGSSGARLAAVDVPPELYDVLRRLGVTRLVPCRPLCAPAASASLPSEDEHRPLADATVQPHRPCDVSAEWMVLPSVRRRPPMATRTSAVARRPTTGRRAGRRTRAP
ncbi:SigB/SigF/SigG family RNA polymerase sigma factor [Nucisporomicrobium flavum]|uniref:SigB/SigF/SigG family RNA polymerase sigma factor n=1 Tax=Nucisporomicrobium flavum TaxID=2785915 RepID=UPI0018F45289|nr:SigB/SigF/SigG family RNA polymerase sigma factor [Nucisporomicrobium flavum]